MGAWTEGLFVLGSNVFHDPRKVLLRDRGADQLEDRLLGRVSDGRDLKRGKITERDATQGIRNSEDRRLRVGATFLIEIFLQFVGDQ